MPENSRRPSGGHRLRWHGADEERVKPDDGSELEPRPHAVDIYERVCDDTIEELERPPSSLAFSGLFAGLHDRARAARLRARAGRARRRRLGEVRRRAALPDRLHRGDHRPGAVLHREHALPGDGLDAQARVPAASRAGCGRSSTPPTWRAPCCSRCWRSSPAPSATGAGEAGRRGRRRHLRPAHLDLLERRGHRLAAGAGRLAGRGVRARDRPDRRDLRDHPRGRPRRLRPLHRDHGRGVLRPVRGPARARRPARLARRDDRRQHRRRGDDRRRDQLRPGARARTATSRARPDAHRRRGPRRASARRSPAPSRRRRRGSARARPRRRAARRSARAPAPGTRPPRRRPPA